MTSQDAKHGMLAALGRIPSGVFIATVCHSGQETGMLASWVQQCGFDPPMITLAVAQKRFLVDWLQKDATFTLNILDESQTDMISHFGKGFAPEEDAFAGLEVDRTASSAPVLGEVLGYMDCIVRERFTPGDHTLVVGEVIGGRVFDDGRPMVHVRKSGAHY